MERPNIYKYSDYRIFLKDMFNYKKKTKKNFSYRFFSNKAGFSSTSFLKLVTQEKRNLTNESISKIAKGFDLKKEERRFLENLVFMNQAKTNEDKNYYFKKMTAISGYTKTNKIEKACYEYFSNWYNLAIREIVIFGNKKFTSRDITGLLNPKVPPIQVEKSLKMLERLGLIRKNGDSCWEKRDKAISTGPQIRSLLIANFHKEMLKLAGESIDRHPTDQRDITGLTISIKNDSLPEIKERIAAFRREILDMACNETDSNQVFQVNIQAFPLSNKIKRKKKK